MTDELRMGAYYYGFSQTGARAVDKVLSAVACAGKAFHSTSEWNDDANCPGHTGDTPVDWIQNAADEAAREIERLRTENAALREALQWFVVNDDTNEGDEPMPEYGGRTWNEINAYWIDGLNRARAALAEDRHD